VHQPTLQDYEEGCLLPFLPGNIALIDYLTLATVTPLSIGEDIEKEKEKEIIVPQSQKNHSTVNLEHEQEEAKVLSVSYRSLEQNLPASNRTNQ